MVCLKKVLLFNCFFGLSIVIWPLKPCYQCRNPYFVIEFHNCCLSLLSNGLCIISINMLLPKPEDFKYIKIYVKPRSGWNYCAQGFYQSYSSKPPISLFLLNLLKMICLWFKKNLRLLFTKNEKLIQKFLLHQRTRNTCTYWRGYADDIKKPIIKIKFWNEII